MRGVLLIILLSCIFGCDDVVLKDNIEKYEYYEKNYSYIEIEGCEYLYFNAYNIVHKGNCKNHSR